MNRHKTFGIPKAFPLKVSIFISIFTLILLTPPAWGDNYKFKFFKPTAKLYENTNNNIPLQVTNDLQRLSKTFHPKTPVVIKSAISPILKRANQEIVQIEKVSSSPVTTLPGEQTTLYDRINNYLQPNYSQIGDAQTSTLINYNRSYNMGQQNYSGFTWQKPIANLHIGVDRQVEPDLFDDKRWLIKDKFVLSVNAQTYLSNLQKEQKIIITDKELGAFAGIEFVRIYRYTHFANSFEEGLTKEYNKLFLSFLLFRGDGFQKMEPYEFVTKEDYLSANAGGMVRIPSIPITAGVGISVNIGALVEYKKMAQVTMQVLGPHDGAADGDKLRVSYEVAKEKSVTAQAEIAADFFQLLKISLFKYELEYNFKDADKMYLTFDSESFGQLGGEGRLAGDFKNLLKLKRPDNINNLKPFITSRERRISENRSSRYSILLLGGEQADETQQVIIENEDEQKMFFKNYSSQLKYVRGFFSSILDSVFRAVFKTGLFKNFKSTRLKKIAIEYEFNPENASNSRNVIIEDEAKLSFNITHQFTAKKTKGFWNRKYRKYAKHFTSQFTSLSHTYASEFDNDNFRGPLTIRTIFRIGRQQLKYLNSLSPAQVDHKIKLICHSVSRSKRKRKKCHTKIWPNYVKYHLSWQPHHDMAIANLKNFLTSVNKYTDSVEDIRYLFGENTFFSGSFKATKPDGHSHLTYFKSGTFQGLGVIDNYRRADIARIPASISQ